MGPGNLVWEPFLKPLIKALVDEGFDGIKNPQCGALHQMYADRFALEVPHGAGSLTWHFIFDGARPWVPPEVVLDPPEFDPAAVDATIPTQLDQWDVRDRRSLARLVAALVAALRGVATQQLAGVPCPRVQFEASALGGVRGAAVSVESRGASRVVLVSAPFASPALRELAFHARPVPTGPAAAALTSPDPSGPPGTWGVAPDYRVPPWAEAIQVTATFALNAAGHCEGPVPCALTLPASCPPPLRAILNDFKAPPMPEGTCLTEHARDAVAASFQAFVRTQIGAALRCGPLFDALAKRAQLQTDPDLWPRCGVSTVARCSVALPGGQPPLQLVVTATPSFPATAPGLAASDAGGSLVLFITPGELAPWSPTLTPDRMADRIVDVVRRRAGR